MLTKSREFHLETPQVPPPGYGRFLVEAVETVAQIVAGRIAEVEPLKRVSYRDFCRAWQRRSGAEVEPFVFSYQGKVSFTPRARSDLEKGDNTLHGSMVYAFSPLREVFRYGQRTLLPEMVRQFSRVLDGQFKRRQGRVPSSIPSMLPDTFHQVPDGHLPEGFCLEVKMLETGIYTLETTMTLHSPSVHLIGESLYLAPAITISASRPFGKILIPDVLNGLESLVRDRYEVCAVTERSEKVRENIFGK